ncbi:MAG TPA: glycosyltransferase family 4 protein [Gaiellaceae bacterium]|nr:glycosyltransferase family 4 protein [Gaiellaceae bacterium]
MARNDIAIYLPATAGLYNRNVQRASGAERQMALLARALSERGYRVAQIVYPVADPVPLPALLTLVERRRHQIGDRSPLGPIREALETWRALSLADAEIVVVRKRTAALAVAAFFCRLRRRRLIFSSANDYEFLHDHFADGRARRVLYSFGVRSADVVVVQSEGQLALARRAFPHLRRLVRLPSFVERAPLVSRTETESEARPFLWIGRVVDYKQPLRYIELARALPEARFLMVPIVDVSEPDSPLLPAVAAAPDATPNLHLLDPLPHAAMLDLIGKSVAVVNTSRFEGMPNVFLEAWARGVPALTLEFDPDGVIARHGLGVAAGGSWERFLVGARQLWISCEEREELSQRTRSYIDRVHSYEAVSRLWQELIGEVLGEANEPGVSG